MSLVSEIEVSGWSGVGLGDGGLVQFPALANPDAVTALVDRPALTVATYKTRVGIGVSTYDTTLGYLVTMALQAGDRYMNNWFTDDGTETGTPETLDESVIVGLLCFVSAQWFFMDPASASLFSIVVSLGRVADPNVSRERKGDIEIEYKGDTMSTSGTGQTQAGRQLPGLVAAEPYWQNHRKLRSLR